MQNWLISIEQEYNVQVLLFYMARSISTSMRQHFLPFYAQGSVAFHLTPIRMVTIKKINKGEREKTSVGKNVEKLKHLFTSGRNIKWCKPLG